MSSGPSLVDEAYAEALLNAVQHNGKPSVQAVASKLLGAHPELRANPREAYGAAEKACAKASALSVDDQKAALEQVREQLTKRVQRREREQGELPDIPGRPERVVTRFSPNPDGPLHLGNLRAAVLSYEYAKKYGGKFLLRFEDTDPKVKPPILEAYDWIRQDLRWLGISCDQEFIQSDRIQVYYEYARKLVASGAAYVCECGRDEFKKYKDAGTSCPHRARPDSSEAFERMLSGGFPEEAAVLRLKSDLSDPNPALRDPALARVIDTKTHPHPRLGSKYTVFPLYNFSTAVDDALMGVTLILRGKEHLTNSHIQAKVQSALHLPSPMSVQYGRLQLEGYILSKSQIRSALASDRMAGVFPSKHQGWDDPRLATLMALRRRGIQPKALVDLIVEVGAKSNEARINWDNLASINRRLVEPSAKRYFMVVDPVTLRVKGSPAPELEARIPLHPGKPSLGSRAIKVPAPDGVFEVAVSAQDRELFATGSVVRLMDLANVKVTSSTGPTIEAELHSLEAKEAEGLRRGIVQWLPKDGQTSARLFKASGMNMSVLEGVVESAISQEKSGTVVQLIRMGYASVDACLPGRVDMIYTHD
ncbi:MAG: glutamate--tRNA ligase [Thermoprotei archaeon]